MKKLLIAFASIVLFLFIGCASTEAAEEEIPNQIVTEEPPVLEETEEDEIEEIQEEPIPYFINWKYKGFGYDISTWVEEFFTTCDAILDDSKLELTLIEKDRFYIIGKGFNPDQAIKNLGTTFDLNIQTKVFEVVSINLEEYEIKETTWVQINPEFKELENSYIAISLYSKKNLD